jgi:hypothetical protein
MSVLSHSSWVFPGSRSVLVVLPHTCSVGLQPGMSNRQGQLGLLLRLFCFSLHHLGARVLAEGSRQLSLDAFFAFSMGLYLCNPRKCTGLGGRVNEVVESAVCP